MLAVPVSGPVVRALSSVRLADQRVRFRDIDCDHVQLKENGKLIDVFTEHFVELQLARHHVRVEDDVRSMDVDSVRVRVRDVDRRRARVTDQENVMDVLTEIVKVSDVVHSSLRAVLGTLSWGAHSEEVSFNETKHERVHFGGVSAEETEVEPVVTEPEDEEEDEEVFQKGDERVLFEEVEDDVPAHMSCECDDVIPEPDFYDAEKLDDVFMDTELPSFCDPNEPEDEYQQLHQQRTKPPLERKWSRRNRTGSSWFIDAKPARRRSWKQPLRRHQSASACIK